MDVRCGTLHQKILSSTRLACMARIVMGVVLAEYKDGFNYMRTLVDVGGRTGGMIAKIVKAHPHIKGIKFIF